MIKPEKTSSAHSPPSTAAMLSMNSVRPWARKAAEIVNIMPPVLRRLEKDANMHEDKKLRTKT